MGGASAPLFTPELNPTATHTLTDTNPNGSQVYRAFASMLKSGTHPLLPQIFNNADLEFNSNWQRFRAIVLTHQHSATSYSMLLLS